MSQDIKVKKQRIRNKIEKEGSISKLNKNETKPYKQNNDVLIAYNDDDVVLTYKGQRYTQKQLKKKFNKIEFFIKLNKRVLMNKGNIVTTALGDTIDVYTIPNKANNSPTKSRRIPRDYVVIKYKQEEGAVAVPKSIFFTNPVIEYRQGLIPDWKEYIHEKFTSEEKCEMIRLLASRPEFKGDTKKKFMSFGNNDSTIIQKMDDKTILALEKRLNELHKKEIERDKLIKIERNERPLTIEEIEIYTDLEKQIYGENEQIKLDFGLNSRGSLTDLRVWFMLLSKGKTITFTEYGRLNAVYVIPKDLAYRILHRLTDKHISEVWEEL